MQRRSNLGGKSSTRRGRPHFATATTVRIPVRSRVPVSQAMPKRVFMICHYCGYDPQGRVPPGGTCPKCHGSSWERFALAEPLVPDHMK